MLYDIIPFIIILVSVAIIIMIFIRRLPEIATIDVATVPEEKNLKFKKQVVEQRFQRLMSEKWQGFYKFFEPFWGKMADIFLSIYKKIKDAVAVFDAKSRLKKQLKEEGRDETLKSLLLGGWKFLEARDWEKAEHNFIAAAGLNNKNLEAYEGLATLYLEQGDSKKAKETLGFIFKLAGSLGVPGSDLARYYYMMSGIYGKENDLKQLEYLKKTCEKDPNNPKYIDSLVEVAIIQNDAVTAKTYLEQLARVNPGNKKIGDFRNKIADLKV